MGYQYIVMAKTLVFGGAKVSAAGWHLLVRDLLLGHRRLLRRDEQRLCHRAAGELSPGELSQGELSQGELSLGELHRVNWRRESCR